MRTLTAIKRFTEVLLADSWVRTVGPPTLSEGLDQLTSTCELQLASMPTTPPATNDTLAVRYVNRDATTYREQFAGSLNRRSVESFPHDLRLIATGPLAGLREVRRDEDGDLDLTGMTDGNAVEAILAYCGVSFVASDIGDAGYVLGERADVFWHVDQTGAEIIAELDRVFAMKTLDIDDGRVIRIAYNLAPTVGQIQRSYTRGVDADFYRNRREVGDRDRIQNRWVVQGVTAPCTGASGGDCSCTPWAKAETDNYVLDPDGRGIRVRSQTFQSEVIQDEQLAREIVKRLMRWYNREPDEVRIEAENDPDIHPGTVVGVTDAAYGISLSAAPYTVTRVDRRGDVMQLTAIGGAAGDVGTVTSGVEQRCNDLNTDIDWPGIDPDFGLPEFSFPPIGIDFDWTIPDFGDWTPDGLSVSASPGTGIYNNPQVITLTANEPATVYYTLDGTVPHLASPTYTVPFLISSNKTLRFFARTTDGRRSAVRSEYYVIRNTSSTAYQFAVTVSGWVTDNPTFSPGVGSLDASGQGAAHNTDVDLDGADFWSIRVIGEMKSNQTEFGFGAVFDTFFGGEMVGALIYEEGELIVFDLFTPNVSDSVLGTSLLANDLFDATLSWDNDTKELTLVLSQDQSGTIVNHALTISDPDPWGFAGPLYPTMTAYGPLGVGHGINAATYDVTVYS